MLAVVALAAAASGAAALPPAAKQLKCDPAANGPTHITVQATVDPSAVDYLSLELWPANDSRGWPQLHFTASADTSGAVRAVVRELRPDTAYVVAARSHRRGWAEDGGLATWSDLVTAAAPCSTKAASSAASPTRPVPATAGPATHWLAVFRIAEEGNELPDFLDNHDCGSLGGDAGFMSGCSLRCPFYNWTGRLPVTRYCVEVLNVTVSNVTTTTLSGLPVDSQYADYKSCNRQPSALSADYVCECDNIIDRNIAHQPKELIVRECPSATDNNTSDRPGRPNMTCTCSDESAAAGAKYVGMMPVGLPMYWSTRNPGGFPTPDSVLGAWYSMPYAGRCPLGAAVGTKGCTWQRSPLSHSVYTRDLSSLGWNTTGKNKESSQDVSETLHNVGVLRAAFDALGVLPCGSL